MEIAEKKSTDIHKGERVMLTKETIASWFKPGKKLAVITGAGISTESGIPDFRSSGGLFSQEVKRNIPLETVLSVDFFESYPKGFFEFYREKLMIKGAQPNEGHRFLKHLEDRGMAVTIITQNIDGLHQLAGSQNVLELHGNAHRFITKSGVTVYADDLDYVDGLFMANGEDVRPDITLYGEQLDGDVLQKSMQAVREADILLVLGTSLIVYPAAGLIYDYQGDKSILVTRGITPLDSYFNGVFDEAISEWTRDIIHLFHN